MDAQTCPVGIHGRFLSLSVLIRASATYFRTWQVYTNPFVIFINDQNTSMRPLFFIIISILLFQACDDEKHYKIIVSDPYDLRFWYISLFSKNESISPSDVSSRYTSPNYVSHHKYESLSKGDYKLLFISRFNDTVVQDFFLSKDTTIEIPDVLPTYYEDLDIDDIENSLMPGDTIYISSEFCSHVMFFTLDKFVYIDSSTVAKVFYHGKSIMKFHIPNFKNILPDQVNFEACTPKYGFCYKTEVMILNRKIISLNDTITWPAFKKLRGLQAPNLPDTTFIDRIKEKLPL